MNQANTPLTAALAMALALATAFAAPVRAQETHPAAAQIDLLDHSILDATRARGGGASALEGVVAQKFNLGVMASFVAGSGWAQFQAGDRQSVIAALNLYVAARLANEFDGDSQRITLNFEVQTRGPDAMVRTRVAEAGEAPGNVDYRLRAYGGVWQVIDVYYNGVSMLATQRADAAVALQRGGAAQLAQHIREAAAAIR